MAKFSTTCRPVSMEAREGAEETPTEAEAVAPVRPRRRNPLSAGGEPGTFSAPTASSSVLVAAALLPLLGREATGSAQREIVGG
jgi:hypothetical protein